MADWPLYTTGHIAKLTEATLYGDGGIEIDHLLTDSRRLIFPSRSLFFALKTDSNDGHNFIAELYQKGVRAFVVAQDFNREPFVEATFLVSSNVLSTLQKLAAEHRSRFHYPVVGITGSNGKTVVKEWLFHFLNAEKRVVRSPRSYNSQIGVPHSLWQMGAQHDTAIIEAGVSTDDEMLRLRDMIKPTIGIYTNVGQAHAAGFKSITAKALEKAQLFSSSEKVIFCRDQTLVKEALLEIVDGDESRLIGWSFNSAANAIKVDKHEANIQIHFKDETLEFVTPFADSGSIENLLNALICAKELGISNTVLVEKVASLQHIEMRLEERKGSNNNLLINDFYNSDPESVRIALELLMQQPKERSKIVVLSEFEGMPEHEKEKGHAAVVAMLNGMQISEVIGVGEALKAPFKKLVHPSQIHKTTEDLALALPKLNWQNAAILLKGARRFTFETIAKRLVEQVHQTWLEVNLSAMAHNLRYYRSIIKPTTKVMAMVKALSYGSGSTEIARLLQYNKVDYLAVAYVDEGITLRQGGIELPIMVINADPSAYERMIAYDLEPELFSLHSMTQFLAVLNREYSGSKAYNIHLKLETGMHRLGLNSEDLPLALKLLKAFKNVHVASVFSHLAASDMPEYDNFTTEQVANFEHMASIIIDALGYRPMLHITNTSGIARFANLQYDMVRLGIGMYGAANSNEEQQQLKNVTRWMTRISQLKTVLPNQSVGYGRAFIAKREMIIATLPVGYADGFFRALSNGKGHVFVAGNKVPVVGNVCMDMIMVDVSGLRVSEGDIVELMGSNITATEMAQQANTIAYEILTHVSPRVPRVYITE